MRRAKSIRQIEILSRPKLVLGGVAFLAALGTAVSVDAATVSRTASPAKPLSDGGGPEWLLVCVLMIAVVAASVRYCTAD